MAFIQVSTENPLGNRPLNLMARQQGMGWLGAAGPTPGDYDNNQAVLGELVAMGAISQDDANNIWAGTASLDDMAVNMTMINQALALTGQMGTQTVQPLPPSTSAPLPVSTAATPAAAAPAAPAATPTPASTTPPQVPSGSTVTYTVSWTPGIGNLTVSGANAISAMQKALPAYRMSVTNAVQTASYAAIGSSAYTVQFTILDSVGHQNVSDVQSVLDAVMRQIVGNNLSSSSITGVYAPGLPGTAPAAAAPSVTQWVETNATLLAFLALGIVVLPALIKKL